MNGAGDNGLDGGGDTERDEIPAEAWDPAGREHGGEDDTGREQIFATVGFDGIGVRRERVGAT